MVPVIVDPAGRRAQTGEGRDARGIASGCGTVGLLKECPACCQAFDVWRLDRVILVEHRRPVVHVINGDEEDVHFRGGSFRIRFRLLCALHT